MVEPIGDTFDRSNTKPLKPGSVCTIQLNGTGPWGISYVEKIEVQGTKR